MKFLKIIRQIHLAGKLFFKGMVIRSKKIINDLLKKIVLAGKKFPQSPLLSTLISIIIGLLISFIIMIITGGFSNAFEGLSILLTYGGRSSKIGDVFFRAGPIILLGLALGIGFKAGLFNIGAPGQFLIGGLVGLCVDNLFPAAGIPGLQLVVSVLAAIVAGAIWSVVPGILKSFFNVSEVITGIMLNYVAVYLSFGIVPKLPFYDANKSSVSTLFSNYGKFPLLSNTSMVDIGIIIAIVCAIVFYIIINKTKLGFKIKAVGQNKDAAQYAGINPKKMIIITMGIAGALVGLAASLFYLSHNPELIRPESTINTTAFDGIFVALIANSNPLGTIFTGFFISYLRRGATTLQIIGYSKHITDVIMGIIIYLVSIQSFIKNLFKKKFIPDKIHSLIKEDKTNA
ncbi:MAG: ABC transporter permease [Acholeplasmatales bacterium]|jgi:simple sugar transport system permease protein|nr:ABC transporter permease [Acholeplasmatales bacterium]